MSFLEIFEFCPNDPHEFNCVSTEGHMFDYTKVDLVNNLPPSIVQDEPYGFNERYLSDSCRFVKVLLS